MRRRKNSASKPHPDPWEDEDLPEVCPTPLPTKKRTESKAKEMKVAKKGSRISSLIEQDSLYPKPPTPFPDEERAEAIASGRRRSKSHKRDFKAPAQASPELPDIDDMVPKPPAAPRPPDISHRPHRPSRDVPKIDLTFATKDTPVEKDLDNDIAQASRVGDSDAHVQDDFHNRSRKFGMTYLEKAYKKSGLHFPDIRDSNMMIGRTLMTPIPPKPAVVNLAWTDDEGSLKTELPEINRKPLIAMDNKILPTPPQGPRARPPRKSAFKRFPDETQEQDLPIKPTLSPKPPKMVASEHIPRELNKTIAQHQQPPRESIANVFEKLPGSMTHTVLMNNQVFTDEGNTANAELSPRQKTAIEYLTNMATRSPDEYYGAYANQNIASRHEDPSDVMSAYGSPPRMRREHSSEYNRVTCHAEKLTDVVVHPDGTMVIDLEDMHISPDALTPSPTDSKPKKLVYPTPKKLSISEQVTTFKQNQTTEASDTRARVVQAEVAWRTEPRLGDLIEEEERKFKEQQYTRKMFSNQSPHSTSRERESMWWLNQARRHQDPQHNSFQRA